MTEKRSNSGLNSEPNIIMPQKYLDKILKLQQENDIVRREEFSILQQQLDRTNVILDQMVKITESGSTIAATKKIIPFQTGSQDALQLNTQPDNPDDYPTIVDIYAQNDSKSIQHMTLINDGPGQIFYIVAHSKTDISTREAVLNVNDQRELFNVFEIRLRSTLPLTTFRLIEGIFRTGGFSPTAKANVEIRPTLQPNEIRVEFDAVFDVAVPAINISLPAPNVLVPNYFLPTYMPPLPPGQTATLVNLSTGLAMPFNIPEFFIIEFFSIFGNLSTDSTVRFYVELIPGQYTLYTALPGSARGLPFNLVLNVNQFNTQGIDPLGAPLGGRNVLAIITNDDPANNMVGDFNLTTILRRMS